MELIFWISVFVILYVYAGYPLLLASVSRGCRPTIKDEALLPTVSLVIAAYNEEKVLREKLENSLLLDYPKDRLEIVVASDGSTDATNQIAESFLGDVVLHQVLPRGGKARALNDVIPRTTGEILVLSDANTMYRPDSIRKLIRNFADPSVGVVSGDVRLVNAADSHSNGEGLYYKYERWLQSMESRLSALIGADGAMYALRRNLFCAPPNEIILDDFVISMSVATQGYKALYEPEAIAIEQGTLTSSEEFRRKVRIVAGGIQALKLGKGVPRWKQPLLMFCYLSHKLLRWLLPCFLFLILLSSIPLAAKPGYLTLLLAQVIFYSVAGAYAVDLLTLRRYRWCGVPYYFCLVNVAALFGLWKGVRGTQTVKWQRTAR